MTDLPRQSFTSLPSPPGGLDQAVLHGRRSRQRRRMAGAAGTSALAVVVALGFVPGHGPFVGQRLIPDSPSSPSSTPSASGRPLVDPVRSAAPHPLATAGVGSPMARPSHPASPTPTPSVSEARSSYRSAGMTRDFRAGDPTGVKVCGGNVSGSGDGSTQSRFNWCLNGAATPTSAGHYLSLEVCRDQTGDSQLDFADGREVDLEVRQGDRVLWQWSASQPASGAPHRLPGPSGSCWTWTTAWTDVDGSGHRLAAGDYELVGTSTAAQLSDYPTSTGVVFHVT